MYSRRPDEATSAWRSNLEQTLIKEKRKQPGVSFPSAAKQEHLLIVRFDLMSSVLDDIPRVRSGLKVLCKFLEKVDKDKIRVDVLENDGSLAQYPLSKYNISVTLGFGATFFEKLKISPEKRPRRIRTMPDHQELNDPFPFTLGQTDMILQICSNYNSVNRDVFYNDALESLQHSGAHRKSKGVYSEARPDIEMSEEAYDIRSSLDGWADVKDMHTGFQRIDGRNLMGFNDGISNPDRLRNDIIWTTAADENEELRDGTYMVFQKITHDLEQWRRLEIEEQEKWIGRSKATGLLLGTLSKEEDSRLAIECQSSDITVRQAARSRLKRLIDQQNDPKAQIFDGIDPVSKSIKLNCPVWSHVRKANPRGADGAPTKIVFRRGYLFASDDMSTRHGSGILFICFQRDITNGFEYIKKHFLNNENFPVPHTRMQFTQLEIEERHRNARFSVQELDELSIAERTALGLNTNHLKDAIRHASQPDSQNTGREGLAGPSKLGVNPSGHYVATVPMGGGYYFIPPIPGRDVSILSEQFFE